MAIYGLALPLCSLMFVVGIRVLVMARRSNGSTEQLVGEAFILLGIGGIPALFAGHDEVFPAELQPAVFAVGQLLLSGAFTCFYLFAWRCFGPNSGWRRGLALAGVTSQVLAFVTLGFFEGFDPSGSALIRVAAVSRGVVMLWAFFESLHYWRLMLRRQSVGLVDPVVTNRFALWSCWTGGLVGAVFIVITARFTGRKITVDFTDPTDSAIVASALLLLTISVVSLTLAFLPPQAYLRWVRREAVTHGA